MRDNFYSLPTNLPIPQDDGACDHLAGMDIPDICLPSTANRTLSLLKIAQSPAVFFFYPRTGHPEESAPIGWDEIPGARGCTPQSCGYRDHLAEFQALGVQVFGVSTQTTKFQQELVQRMSISYEILSDSDFALSTALRLPSFEYNSMRLFKRMAFFANQGMIKKVFYPVFPPDKNAENVLIWLQNQA